MNLENELKELCKCEISDEITYLNGEKIKVYGFGYYDTKDPRKNNYRYYLELNIPNLISEKTLITILMNPSNTFPAENGKCSKIDPTIHNIIKIAYSRKQYSKLVILNSYPLINGNSDNNESILKQANDKNIAVIKSCFNKYLNNADYLIAWGGNSKKIKNEQEYLEAMSNNRIENIYAYHVTKKGKPCHASIIVENRRHYVSEFIDKNKDFVPLTIMNNKNKFILIKDI